MRPLRGVLNFATEPGKVTNERVAKENGSGDHDQGDQSDEQGILDHAGPPDIYKPDPDPSFHQFPLDLGQQCTGAAQTAYRSSVPKSATSLNGERAFEGNHAGLRPYGERDSK